MPVFLQRDKRVNGASFYLFNSRPLRQPSTPQHTEKAEEDEKSNRMTKSQENSLLWEEDSSSKKPWVVPTSKIRDSRDQRTLNFFSKKVERGGSLEGSQNLEASLDEPSYKSKSIMVIRKLHKKMESIVQNERNKYEEEFYKRKEVPIHHSQYYFHQRAHART
jgi:hypothetical protein